MYSPQGMLGFAFLIRPYQTLIYEGGTLRAGGLVDLPENHGTLTLIILAPELTPAIAERFHISSVLYNLNVRFERLSAICFFHPGKIRLYMKRLCLLSFTRTQHLCS